MRIRRRTRSGATVVETAAVLSVFVLFFFGVFEYCRYVMIENLLINAVRDGCRYALVHCQDVTVVSDTQGAGPQKDGRDGQPVGRGRIQHSGVPDQQPDVTAEYDQPGRPDHGVGERVDPGDLFPALPFIPSSFTMSSASVMVCEGN